MRPVFCLKIKKDRELKQNRVFLSVTLFFLISFNSIGQCVDGPTVTLSSTSGIACRDAAITVSGNTFGGSATRVTIRENGDGSVTPTSSTNSPFSFTYTPRKKDVGRTVIITVTTNNPLGWPCEEAVERYTLTVVESLPAPLIGTIIQPMCTVTTGSVELFGLPSNGTWSLTRNPGSVTTSGTGTSTTITELETGTYNYVVTNAGGCISTASENIVINEQPVIPEAPTVGIITPPTCASSTGNVVLYGLPSSGPWMLTRYPGTITSMGIGANTTVTGLVSGTYNFTVTDFGGCVSIPSTNVSIPAQPPAPSAPVIETIIQPTYAMPSGSVVLSGLPSAGTWILTRSPGGVTTQGTGTSITITGLSAGQFTFVVTNSSGCTSAESDEVLILNLESPTIIITDPPVVCSPETVDLTASEVTQGSTPGLIYTYWTDSLATIPYYTPVEATSGTYYIKGTTLSGYFDIKPVNVTIHQSPVANAGPDQILEYRFETTMDAEPLEQMTGVWSVVSGSGEFFDETYAKTVVSELSPGENILLWTVDNGICMPSLDTVLIRINELVIPTMITPNMDGKNDYFQLKGISTLGKTELVIFDRRGVQVYSNGDYDNLWNGVDDNEKPLPDDTYFYILRSVKGKPIRGYIVIKK